MGLTAAAVLQGSNLAVTRRRVVHRLAGTVAGVGLTFAVLGWNPPLWVVVLAVAVAQFAVELVIATHYGLAVTAITVLALGLFHLGDAHRGRRFGAGRAAGRHRDRGGAGAAAAAAAVAAGDAGAAAAAAGAGGVRGTGGVRGGVVTGLRGGSCRSRGARCRANWPRCAR